MALGFELLCSIQMQLNIGSHYAVGKPWDCRGVNWFYRKVPCFRLAPQGSDNYIKDESLLYTPIEGSCNEVCTYTPLVNPKIFWSVSQLNTRASKQFFNAFSKNVNVEVGNYAVYSSTSEHLSYLFLKRSIYTLVTYTDNQSQLLNAEQAMRPSLNLIA